MDTLEITTADALWGWLAEHHAISEGVHLITWKAAHKDRYVSRDAVLDALVAYGWVDGRRFVVDDDRTAQLITPRKVRHWAQSYKDRAPRLIAEGRMQTPGLDSIAAGKKSGLWDFMADVDALIVPSDLLDALDGHRATNQWKALAPSYRRNVLRWIKLAKTDATRAERIAQTAKTTARGEKIAQM